MTTLPGYRTYAQTPVGGPGPGTASLALGLLALPLALLCGLGVAAALAGLVVGIVAFARDRGRAQAVAGIGVSALALVLAGFVIVWFLGKAAKCGDTRQYPDRAARARCVEREFPLVRHHASY
jgi:hypothetical protein